jgi:hypothetical protein
VANLFDELSKQAAKAISRRDALKVTGRGIFGLLLTPTPVGRLWGRMMRTQSENGSGSSTCGAIQKTIQLAFPDPRPYRNHGSYVSAIAQSVAAAEEAELITDDCSGCIVNQFARGVSITDQQPCGPVVLPTQFCGQTKVPSQSQIQNATELALGGAPTAFSDGQQFELFIVLVEEILGCLLSGGGPQQPQVQPATKVAQGLALVADPTPQCITPGVNYCGPGNSLERWLPTVAPCLNGACFQHDNCYGEDCTLGTCYFTNQTLSCDTPLLETCLGSGSCSLSQLLDPPTLIETLVVCAAIECLMGLAVSPICKIQRIARSSQPACLTPASVCISCNGQSPCGPLGAESCCPCGQTCANGSCQCGPTEIYCSQNCCSQGQKCSNESCVPCDPSSGDVPCGITCCPSAQECSNNTCVPCRTALCGGACCGSAAKCSNGTCFPCTPCGDQCCSADLGEICSNGNCLTCPPGQIPCSTACCSFGQTCQNGSCVSGCPPGGCPSGSVCFGGLCCRPTPGPPCCPFPNFSGGLYCTKDGSLPCIC